jgi:hypothetical protein
MTMDISEEQIEILKATTLTNGQNAWKFVQSRPQDAQPWVVKGILSCIEKDYRLDLLMIGWETRDIRRVKSNK